MRVCWMSCVLLLLYVSCAWGQLILPRAPEVPALGATGAPSTPKSQLLPQAGLAFSETKPKLALDLFNYYVELGSKARLPVYLLSTLATLSEVTKDDAVAGILDEFGGLANVSLGFVPKRFTPFGELASEEDGVFLDARIGGKVVGVPDPSDSTKTKAVLFGEAIGNLRGQFPVFSDSDDSRKGDVTLLASVAVNYSTDDKYKVLLDDAKQPALFFINLSAALSITDRIYVGGGGTVFSSDEGIEDRWYVSASILNESKGK